MANASDGLTMPTKQLIEGYSGRLKASRLIRLKVKRVKRSKVSHVPDPLVCRLRNATHTLCNPPCARTQLVPLRTQLLLYVPPYVLERNSYPCARTQQKHTSWGH